MNQPNNPVGQQPYGKASRSVKNYALQPLLQVKLGLYSILLSLAFALAVAGILYFNLAKFSAIILQLTGVEEEVQDILNQLDIAGDDKAALLKIDSDLCGGFYGGVKCCY